MSNFKLEICCSTVEGAINAYHGGADRIEINTAIELGGLTPSIATIEEIKAKTEIPVMTMIRPRTGGFNYSKVEFEIMKRNLIHAIKAGTDGVVFGILDSKSHIDISRNKELLRIAQNNSVETVFHRAFDVTPNPLFALNKLIELGFDRVLTSAQSNKIIDNLNLAKKLINNNKNQIEILLCGGIRHYNMIEIIKETQCNQIHLTALNERKDESMFNKAVKFNSSNISEHTYKITSKDKVLKIKKELENKNKLI